MAALRSAAVLTLGLALMMPAAGAPRAAEPSPGCFEQLVRGKGPQIACEFPLRMTDKELADLRRASRDILQDAACTMTVRLDRALILAAVENDNHVFEAPPQPVACEIRTAKELLPIQFTFAPRIEIKAGIAVKATAGMANVTGVSRLLSLPVVVFVNTSRQVETGMLDTVNAYLRFVRGAVSAR